MLYTFIEHVFLFYLIYLINMTNSDLSYKDVIKGANILSNYIWFLILFIGGFGFFLAGLESYLGVNLLPFFDGTALMFLPQGILLLFYGTLATLLAFFLLFWANEKVGSGFNEYNSNEKVVRIFRKGLSFLNNDIYLVYPFSDISHIELEIVDNINPRRVLYLCLKDNRSIPLTPSNELKELNVLEKQGMEIADLIGVSLILNTKT